MANAADSLAVEGGRKNCLLLLIRFIRTTVFPALRFLFASLTVYGHPQKPRILTSCDKVFHRGKIKRGTEKSVLYSNGVILLHGQVNNQRVCRRRSWWGRTSSQSLVLFAISSVQEACHGLCWNHFPRVAPITQRWFDITCHTYTLHPFPGGGSRAWHVTHLQLTEPNEVLCENEICWYALEDESSIQDL